MYRCRLEAFVIRQPNFSLRRRLQANAAQSPVYGHHNHNNHDSLLRPFVNSTQTNSDAPKSSRAAQTSAEAAAPEKFLQFIAPYHAVVEILFKNSI